MSAVLDAMQRRYATKAYDTSKKVSADDLHTILEAMRLAPSSFGLQPWKFIVVENTETREQLKANSRGQPQVTDASHLIVLAVKKAITEADVDAYMQSVASTRNMPIEALAEYKWMIIGTVGSRDEASMHAWNAKQAYIALGIWILTAAQLHIDATPMEGFDASKYDEVLGLGDYTTAVIMPIGYRAESDQSQHYAKVRFSAEQIVEYK